jgi:competence protein ComEC
MINRWNDYLIIILTIFFIVRLIQAWPLYSPKNQENYLLLGFRETLSSKIDQIIPDPQGSVFKGILFGIQSNLSSDLKKSFVNTSTIHIIVASGQNLTILSGFILSLARFFGRKKVVLGSILIDLLYCFITGLQIPIIRAFIMVSFASAAQLFNRDWDSKVILALTALAMLSFDPNLLLSVSFQLSFAATTAVLVVSPILMKQFDRLPLIKEDLIITISAQALTLPIIAANFGQISLIGVLANVLILWAITPIMILGFIGTAVAFVNLFVAKIILVVPFLLTSYLVSIVTFLNQGLAIVTIGKLSWVFWIGYYLVIGVIVFQLARRQKELVEAAY